MKLIGVLVIILIVLVFAISQIPGLLYSKIPFNIGDKAPSFTLLDADKKEVALSSFLGKPLVIYFFPKAETPGCTKQACALRDAYADFKENNIAIIGISYDTSEKLAGFKQNHHLPFTLLSDSDKKVAALYGANRSWPFNFFPHRITFLVDKDGIIKSIMPDVTVSTHAAKIFEEAQKLNN